MTTGQTTAKPLFIPLKAEFFSAFEQGTKMVEFRVYGPRWNENTCRPGRPVTLSYGYNGRRLPAEIVAFDIVGPDADPAIPVIFPGKTEIAAIRMRIVSEKMEPQA